MHLNSMLAPVKASRIFGNSKKFILACEDRQKSVSSKTAQITGWARITDLSVARFATAGGGSLVIRAMTTWLNLIRC